MTRPFFATGVGMIHLAFTAPLEGAPRQVSAEAFLLRGGHLERDPQREPVAFKLAGCWEVEAARFARLECADRVLCLFEEDGAAGEKHGPFSGVAVVDDTLRSGERVIATLRGSYWQSEKTQRAWPRVRVVEPPSP
jgi:hypothetical protein